MQHSHLTNAGGAVDVDGFAIEGVAEIGGPTETEGTADVDDLAMENGVDVDGLAAEDDIDSILGFFVLGSPLLQDFKICLFKELFLVKVVPHLLHVYISLLNSSQN